MALHLKTRLNPGLSNGEFFLANFSNYKRIYLPDQSTSKTPNVAIGTLKVLEGSLVSDITAKDPLFLLNYLPGIPSTKHSNDTCLVGIKRGLVGNVAEGDQLAEAFVISSF